MRYKKPKKVTSLVITDRDGMPVYNADTFRDAIRQTRDYVKWLLEELPPDYEFVYNYEDAAALLHAYEPYVSLAAISRASGINQGLLSHYANRLKKPRPEQRRRIVDGLHKIGNELQHVTC